MIEKDTTLNILELTSIKEKAKLIASTISDRYFDKLRMKISVTEILNGKLSLNVDLIENEDFGETLIPSWNQNFSASCSAKWTRGILDANFYQKEYKGKWVDTVKYYLRGS